MQLRLEFGKQERLLERAIGECSLLATSGIGALRLVRFLRTWHGSNGGAVRASALVELKSKKERIDWRGPADPLAVVGCLRSVGARGLGGKKNEQP